MNIIEMTKSELQIRIEKLRELEVKCSINCSLIPLWRARRHELESMLSFIEYHELKG